MMYYHDNFTLVRYDMSNTIERPRPLKHTGVREVRTAAIHQKRVYCDTRNKSKSTTTRLGPTRQTGVEIREKFL